MKIKYKLLIFILLTSTLYIHSEDNIIKNYNERAKKTYSFDPSNSLYYADKSIDLNINLADKEQYIESLYIKSLCYEVLEESVFQNKYISLALSFIKDRNIKYINDEFYLFYIKTMYNSGNYMDLTVFFESEDIFTLIDDKSIIERTLYKIKINNILNKPIDYTYLNGLLKNETVKSNPDLLSEIYLVYGDIIYNTNIKDAHNFYLKSAESLNTYHGATALFRLGKQLNNINYLRESYLTLELLEDKFLILDVLNELLIQYKRVGDYKKSTQTLETINFISNNNSQFLLIQNKKIERFNFTNEKLNSSLDRANAQLNIYFLIIISMGAAIFILILFVSIQTYRLRGFNI